MVIQFSGQDKPQKWFGLIADQFGVSIHDNAFSLPDQIGDGIFRQFYFFEGLTLTYLHFRLNEQLEFIRHSVDEAQLIPIMFYNQDELLEQEIDNRKTEIGYHTPQGIFMASPQISSKWLIPTGKLGYQITITIDKQWLLSSVSQESYLTRLLLTGRPFYLFESLTTGMMQIIQTLHSLINADNVLRNLSLHKNTMELLSLFLSRLEQRVTIKEAIRLNAKDIEKIFQVRELIIRTLPGTCTLGSLADSAAMSKSKLQKCFQQVFGKSISQYALAEKMNLARQLLDTGKYSVSEVGYTVGYSNLSHFTEAFRKEFGVNPKSYIKDQ
jgi:AraC-like DNA-binding protein